MPKKSHYGNRAGKGFEPKDQRKRTNRFSPEYKPSSERERARYVNPDGTKMTEEQILFRELMSSLKK